MLRQLSVNSFRTLRRADVEFRDGLNIIIGKNGVGKSNLLKFIAEFTSAATRFGSLHKVTFSRGAYSFRISIHISDKTDQAFLINIEQLKGASGHSPNGLVTSICKLENGQVVSEYPDVWDMDSKEWAEFQTEFSKGDPYSGTFVRYDLPASLSYASAPTNLYFDDEGDVEMGNDNELHFLNEFEVRLSELTNSLFANDSFYPDEIKAELQDLFDEVVADFELDEAVKRFTNLQSVRLSPNINLYHSDTGWNLENLVLEFKVDDRWMPWSYLSDGTKRSFYLIAQVAYAQNELVLIEEPELGLHPTQLFNLMTFIKEQAESKQIILSTHSPIVLDALNADELDHILIARLEKGVSTFRQMSEAAKEKARRYMNEVGDLSSFWLHSNMEDHD